MNDLQCCKFYLARSFASVEGKWRVGPTKKDDVGFFLKKLNACLNKTTGVFTFKKKDINV